VDFFFAQKQNFSAYCKKAVRLHRRKREPKKAVRPCQLWSETGTEKSGAPLPKNEAEKRQRLKYKSPQVSY